MNIKIEPQWKKALELEFGKTYFRDLVSFVKEEYKTTIVYPPAKKTFSAFELTPFEEVKVVIIGQDPYHGPNQANGLSFSVVDGVRIPPSLQNIYKELESDIGKEIPSSGNLEPWAKQGVLLLNATLTVRASQPGSHQNRGWETFTDTVIQKLSEDRKDIVFLLWGSYAQRKGNIIDRRKHYVIEAPHPSPLAAYRGFFGSKPFSKINYYLEQKGLKKINW